MKKFVAGVLTGFLLIAIVQSPPMKPVRDQTASYVVQFMDAAVDSYNASRNEQKGEDS